MTVLDMIIKRVNTFRDRKKTPRQVLPGHGAVHTHSSMPKDLRTYFDRQFIQDDKNRISESDVSRNRHGN